jgi:hypothetical protein
MGSRSRARKLPAAVRRELEVAAAVAREAVFATHAARAEALIQLAGDRVSAPRMLQVYVRLHSLSEQDALYLSNRVLAEIGKRAAKARPAPAAVVDAETPSENDEPGSLIAHIRHRLRGRVLHDLRRGVELYAGVTELALLKVHVKHALRFHELLEPAGESVSGAVRAYRETLGVRASYADMLYYSVLDRLAAEQPPVPLQLEGATQPAAAEPAPKSQLARKSKLSLDGGHGDGVARALG